MDLGQVVGGNIAFDEAWLGENIAQQRNVVGDTSYDVRVQCFDTGLQRFLASGAVAGQLADHRVVVDTDLAALFDAAVAAHVGRDVRRFDVTVQAADGRQAKVLERIFGVDAAFDCPAFKRYVGLLQFQRMA